MSTVEEKARRRADLSPMRSPIRPYRGPPSSWHTEKLVFLNKVEKILQIMEGQMMFIFVNAMQESQEG